MVTPSQTTDKDLADFVRKALNVCTVLSVDVHPDVPRIDASDIKVQRHIAGPASIRISVEMVLREESEEAQDLLGDSIDMAKRMANEINNSESRW